MRRALAVLVVVLLAAGVVYAADTATQPDVSVAQKMFAGAYTAGFSPTETIGQPIGAVNDHGIQCWGWALDAQNTDQHGRLTLQQTAGQLQAVSALPCDALLEEASKCDMPEAELRAIAIGMTRDFDRKLGQEFCTWLTASRAQADGESPVWKRGPLLVRGRLGKVDLKSADRPEIIRLILRYTDTGDGKSETHVVGFLLMMEIVNCAAGPPVWGPRGRFTRRNVIILGQKH